MEELTYFFIVLFYVNRYYALFKNLINIGGKIGTYQRNE